MKLYLKYAAAAVIATAFYAVLAGSSLDYHNWVMVAVLFAPLLFVTALFVLSWVFDAR